MSTVSLPPLVEPGPQLSPDELRRYARNLRVPQIGELGQRRLRAARVLCVGAGALGSPALLYLAAAGVGTLGIVDNDVVELSNLQRQVIHAADGIGEAKTTSAAARIRALNPEARVLEHRERIDAGDALELVGAYDLVIDGSDNFATRYVVSDACEIAGLPHVWGSILRFDGQVSVFWAQHGPTYRDLHPVPPRPGSVPSCAEAGVLGALPGVLGSTLALEAMKLIMGAGEPLVGRISICDALDGTWAQVPLRRSPAAVPVTQMSPFADPARDGYPGASSSPGPDPDLDAAPASSGGPDPDLLSPERLGELLHERSAGEAAFELVDVREPWEHRLERIDGARLIPLGEFTAGDAAAQLEGAQDVVLHCQAGIRSAEALGRLRAADDAAGVTRRIRHLDGGLSSWSGAGLPTGGD